VPVAVAGAGRVVRTKGKRKRKAQKSDFPTKQTAVQGGEPAITETDEKMMTLPMDQSHIHLSAVRIPATDLFACGNRTTAKPNKS